MAQKKETYPVLPLRDIVVYPKMIVPLFVGRTKSIKALQEVIDTESLVVLLTQKDAAVEEPLEDDVYQVGTLGSVLQMLKLPDGTLKVLIEGVRRVRVSGFVKNDDFMEACVDVLTESERKSMELEALARAVVSQFEEYVKLSKKTPPEVLVSVSQIEDYGKLADTIASHLALKVSEKQELLEASTLKVRFEKILGFMNAEMTLLEVENKIKTRVKKQMEKSQKEYYLNEQMKAIQKELGDDEQEEFAQYMKKIEATKLSPEAREKAVAEAKKLKTMSVMSSEATVVRNYLDWLLDIPWKKTSKVNKDLVLAKEILDRDHYGLDKVKERILEFLAVQARAEKVKGPILCLVGPPGVGKTSIAKSIATAMGRKFVQVSLGGVNDESVIRGHRRTYVGAMCGRILAGMKQAGTINPVFLLDEIDKLSRDIKGDPASALLEVLDPAQNDHFKDNFLEIPYDLSQVLFVLTANSLRTIPAPLLDRMEIIELRSYTEFEKIEIAKRHLISKQEKLCGLKEGTVKLDDELLRKIIQEYTYESGVRGLERQIAAICRKYATDIAEEKPIKEITLKNFREFLGNEYNHEQKIFQGGNVGEVVGLATNAAEIGSCLLIECAYTNGTGKLILTGQMGKVSQESANAAYSLIKQMADKLNIKVEFNKIDLHIHYPALPYGVEGPSAGITTVVAIASAFTNRKVKPLLAMTGEVSLRGRVLPVGGIRDKLIAANRSGMKTIIIPKDNEQDLKDLPKNVRDSFDIHFATHIEQVLEIALEPEKASKSKTQDTKKEATKSQTKNKNSEKKTVKSKNK